MWPKQASHLQSSCFCVQVLWSQTRPTCLAVLVLVLEAPGWDENDSHLRILCPVINPALEAMVVWLWAGFFFPPGPQQSVCGTCCIKKELPLLPGLLVEFATITQAYHPSCHCWHLTWYREASSLAWDSQTHFSMLLKVASPAFPSKLGSLPSSLFLPQDGLLTWTLALSNKH